MNMEPIKRLGYGLDDRSSIPGSGNELFSLRHRVQTGSRDHSASYPMDTGGSYAGGNAVRESS
jgi:hypothetical protein